jgi:uncharacterized protein YkwD
LRSTHQNGAAARHVLSTLVHALRRHRALTRVSLATLSLGVALAASLQGAAAGPEPTPTTTRSILPEVIGTGLATDQSVVIGFDQAMNPASVTEALRLRPASGWIASWSDDGTQLTLAPTRRWQTDARYVATIGAAARTASGRALGESRSFSFTTETAPVITDFQLFYVEETPADRARADAEASVLEISAASAMSSDTSSDVSAATRIAIGFSSPMRHADVERAFTISPSVKGDLTWSGNQVVFVPRERLKAGARYAVSLIGARDERGNPLGGDVAFSFTTRKGGQVVRIAPRDGAKNVDPDALHLWFSQPMDTASVRSSLRVEAPSGRLIRGKLSWNEAGTQLRFAFNDPLNAGKTFRVRLGKGARDADGNVVKGTWRFTTTAPPPVVQLAQPAAPTQPTGPAPAPPPPPTGGPNAPSDVLAYALWQINQSRADYGFAPLRLDGAISKVAADHAWDMLRYNYFSHTGRDGSRAADRMRRAGIGFSWSGENICYYSGIGVRATLDWCHRTFMAEPYPGYFNHIANILNPKYTRVGVGIAESGGKVKIVWDFAG